MKLTRGLALPVLLSCALVSACGQNTPIPKARATVAAIAGKRHFDHVVIIILENEDAKTVTDIPYMDSLAKSGAYLADYFGVAHPSYPNYLAMVSGQTFIGSPKAIEDPTAHEDREFGDGQLLIDAPSLASRLESAKLSWNVFAEDYPVKDSVPASCDFSRRQGLYARKHVPFLSFKEFHDDPKLCAHIRELKWWRSDSLAAYTMVIPNMDHDGHDTPLPTAVTWLRGFLKPILSNPEQMKSTLIVVTFDESATSRKEKLFGAKRPNQIYAALLGGMVKPGAVSNEPFTHYSLLKMVEENFGLGQSLAPAGTNAIDGVWQ